MIQYREMKVWEKAHAATLQVFRLTLKFPKAEQCGFAQLVREKAVSMTAKISEGCRWNSDPELARCFEAARVSAGTLDYLLMLSKEIGYLGEADYEALSENLLEVQKMLAVFTRKVRERIGDRKQKRSQSGIE
jgi:four helix bundle protein